MENKLYEYFKEYKADLPERLDPKNEGYKWIAIKHFKEHWNIDAEDFASMFEEATSKAGNLLAAYNFYPRSMITAFITETGEPETVRTMFRVLYDETRDLKERLDYFVNESERLRSTYGPEKWKNHFQNYNAISTYLWLRFPDKYYIYKYSEYAKIVKALEVDVPSTRDVYLRLTSAFSVYDKLSEVAREDEELRNIFNTYRVDGEYEDPEFKTVAIDIGFFISRSQASLEQSPVKESLTLESTEEAKPYSKNDFLGEVFMGEDEYNRFREMLEFKKNIILCGAPGVGKTFAAKRLAYSIMGEKDDSRIGFIQFHQNYSYEDFILGYKPTEDGGFALKEGIFYKFCKKAASDDRPYFFIIDEINRGNLSKIFGELLMSLESDYRGEEVELAYGERRLVVPKNVYVIGMMNTADRSLALMDYALRRRFGFYNLKPAFDDPVSEKFKVYQKSLNSELFNNVIDTIRQLNNVIREDDSLGEGFCIGHSHFSNLSSDDELKNIIDFAVLPTLKEYWFDDENKYEEWREKLTGLFDD